jgi:hypothetical protein
MTHRPGVKYCARYKHPVDSDQPCVLCAQEDRDQEDRDDKLAEALARLVKRGKISGVVISQKDTAV